MFIENLILYQTDLILERFSLECRETKTKQTVTYHLDR